MKKKELLIKIKDLLLRKDPINSSMKLSEIEEWDSLAIISIISLYDKNFSTVITVEKINKCETIKDLINLVSDKIKNQ